MVDEDDTSERLVGGDERLERFVSIKRLIDKIAAGFHVDTSQELFYHHALKSIYIPSAPSDSNMVIHQQQKNIIRLLDTAEGDSGIEGYVYAPGGIYPKTAKKLSTINSETIQDCYYDSTCEDAISKALKYNITRLRDKNQLAANARTEQVTNPQYVKLEPILIRAGNDRTALPTMAKRLADISSRQEQFRYYGVSLTSADIVVIQPAILSPRTAHRISRGDQKSPIPMVYISLAAAEKLIRSMLGDESYTLPETMPPDWLPVSFEKNETAEPHPRGRAPIR